MLIESVVAFWIQRSMPVLNGNSHGNIWATIRVLRKKARSGFCFLSKNETDALSVESEGSALKVSNLS